MSWGRSVLLVCSMNCFARDLLLKNQVLVLLPLYVDDKLSISEHYWCWYKVKACDLWLVAKMALDLLLESADPEKSKVNRLSLCSGPGYDRSTLTNKLGACQVKYKL